MRKEVGMKMKVAFKKRQICNAKQNTKNILKNQQRIQIFKFEFIFITLFYAISLVITPVLLLLDIPFCVRKKNYRYYEGGNIE